MNSNPTEIVMKKELSIKILQDKSVRYVFHLLWHKACREQMLKDTRLYSSRMRDIEELKKWYFATPSSKEGRW